MVDRSNWNDEFEKTYLEYLLLPETEEKCIRKHKVYREDIEDALGDQSWVIRRSIRKSPIPKNGQTSKGRVYDVFGETTNGRVLFITGRLFPNGTFLIITSMWITDLDEDIVEYYKTERELIHGD